jgi:catechol 2,3-dioxygenase-like lactoylglutathione lyase family enzyme
MAASAEFYDAVLGELGASRLIDEFPVTIGYASGYQRMPEFWIGQFNSGEGFRESHFAFEATDREEVRAVFNAAKELGAEVLHEPRLWPEYAPMYYAGYFRDPDGNNIEVVSFFGRDE